MCANKFIEYVHIQFKIQLLLLLLIKFKIHKVEILASLLMVGEQGQPIAKKECHEVVK